MTMVKISVGESITPNIAPIKIEACASSSPFIPKPLLMNATNALIIKEFSLFEDRYGRIHESTRTRRNA